ncbi:MAG: glycosyltransferase [Caldilineaceae bacterium]
MPGWKRRRRAMPMSRILRWTDDMRGLMRHAAGSVSQCGYNTTMDLLASGVPALVVPYHTPHDLSRAPAPRLADAVWCARSLRR